MKKNQMEVMRAARTRALYAGVTFYTMNLAHPSGKKHGGSITVAYKKLSFYRDSFRVQYSFCSPCEKNPSRIFGEGQAALRYFNDKSALILTINGSFSGGTLGQAFRLGALEYANIRKVSWLADATIKDLV